jgi:hypothetical protein
MANAAVGQAFPAGRVGAAEVLEVVAEEAERPAELAAPTLLDVVGPAAGNWGKPPVPAAEVGRRRIGHEPARLEPARPGPGRIIRVAQRGLLNGDEPLQVFSSDGALRGQEQQVGFVQQHQGVGSTALDGQVVDEYRVDDQVLLCGEDEPGVAERLAVLPRPPAGRPQGARATELFAAQGAAPALLVLDPFGVKVAAPPARPRRQDDAGGVRRQAVEKLAKDVPSGHEDHDEVEQVGRQGVEDDLDHPFRLADPHGELGQQAAARLRQHGQGGRAGEALAECRQGPVAGDGHGRVDARRHDVMPLSLSMAATSGMFASSSDDGWA